MRDALLPAAFSYASFALATIATSRQQIHLFIGFMIVTGLLTSFFIGPVHADFAFTIAWAVVLCCACIAASGRPRPAAGAFGLALGVGLAVGLLSGVSDRPFLTLSGSPALMLTTLAYLSTYPAVRIGIRIGAGWLSAIALLSISVPLVTTPGYQKDHME